MRNSIEKNKIKGFRQAIFSLFFFTYYFPTLLVRMQGTQINKKKKQLKFHEGSFKLLDDCQHISIISTKKKNHNNFFENNCLRTYLYSNCMKCHEHITWRAAMPMTLPIKERTPGCMSNFLVANQKAPIESNVVVARIRWSSCKIATKAVNVLHNLLINNSCSPKKFLDWSLKMK